MASYKTEQEAFWAGSFGTEYIARTHSPSYLLSKDLIDGFQMKLVDYGFIYKRDNWAPQDDITWFLLEK